MLGRVAREPGAQRGVAPRHPRRILLARDADAVDAAAVSRDAHAEWHRARRRLRREPGVEIGTGGRTHGRQLARGGPAIRQLLLVGDTLDLEQPFEESLELQSPEDLADGVDIHRLALEVGRRQGQFHVGHEPVQLAVADRAVLLVAEVVCRRRP